MIFDPTQQLSTLQNMIDTAPAGTLIELSAGTYNITQTINISRSDITLRGTGGDTVFVMDPALRACPSSEFLEPRAA